MTLAKFRGTTVSAVVTIAVIVSGCDSASRDESLAVQDHGFTVRDSAGIEIIENHAPRYPAGEFWTIDPEPEFVLADDSARLDWTAGIARLPDGRVATLSFSNKQLFIFDPSGELSRTIGRPGEGPGEFGIPELMQYLPPDTLVVWERFGASIDYFDTAGTLLRERSVDYAGLMEHGATYENPFRLPLPDGSFLIGVRKRAAGQPQEDCSHLDSRLSFAGQDEITVPGEQLLRIDDANAAHPFGCSRPGSRMAVGGDPVAVYISNTGDQVHQRSLDGTLVRIIRRTTVPPPVTDRAWAAELEARERSREALSGPMWMGGDGEPRRRMAYPAIEALLVDAEGYLWVNVWSDSGSGLPDRWSVFNEEGRWLGVLALPANPEPTDLDLCSMFSPCWVGKDYFLMIRRDELGRERVEGYRIRRGQAGSAGAESGS